MGGLRERVLGGSRRNAKPGDVQKPGFIAVSDSERLRPLPLSTEGDQGKKEQLSPRNEVAAEDEELQQRSERLQAEAAKAVDSGDFEGFEKIRRQLDSVQARIERGSIDSRGGRSDQRSRSRRRSRSTRHRRRSTADHKPGRTPSGSIDGPSLDGVSATRNRLERPSFHSDCPSVRLTGNHGDSELPTSPQGLSGDSDAGVEKLGNGRLGDEARRRHRRRTDSGDKGREGELAKTSKTDANEILNDEGIWDLEDWGLVKSKSATANLQANHESFARQKGLQNRTVVPDSSPSSIEVVIPASEPGKVEAKPGEANEGAVAKRKEGANKFEVLPVFREDKVSDCSPVKTAAAEAWSTTVKSGTDLNRKETSRSRSVNHAGNSEEVKGAENVKKAENVKSAESVTNEELSRKESVFSESLSQMGLPIDGSTADIIERYLPPQGVLPRAPASAPLTRTGLDVVQDRTRAVRAALPNVEEGTRLTQLQRRLEDTELRLQEVMASEKVCKQQWMTENLRATNLLRVLKGQDDQIRDLLQAQRIAAQEAGNLRKQLQALQSLCTKAQFRQEVERESDNRHVHGQMHPVKCTLSRCASDSVFSLNSNTGNMPSLLPSKISKISTDTRVSGVDAKQAGLTSDLRKYMRKSSGLIHTAPNLIEIGFDLNADMTTMRLFLGNISNGSLENIKVALLTSENDDSSANLKAGNHSSPLRPIFSFVNQVSPQSDSSGYHHPEYHHPEYHHPGYHHPEYQSSGSTTFTIVPPIVNRLRVHEQKALIVACHLSGPISNLPRLNITFLLPDATPCCVSTPLPYNVCRFIEPRKDIVPSDFLQLWNSHLYLLSEIAKNVHIPPELASSLPLLVERLVLHGSLEMYLSFDINPQVLSLAGVFTPHKTASLGNTPLSILVLIKCVLPKPEAPCVTFRIRSSDYTLNESVANDLMQNLM